MEIIKEYALKNKENKLIMSKLLECEVTAVKRYNSTLPLDDLDWQQLEKHRRDAFSDFSAQNPDIKV